MEDLQENIAVLYKKWLDQTATEKERQQLLQLLETVADEDVLSPAMQQVWNELDRQQLAPKEYAREKIDALLKKYPGNEKAVFSPVSRIPLYRRWWMAASIILLFATGAYWWYRDNRQQIARNNFQPATKDIQPGKEGAILTLADGTQVTLDSAGNGLIADQNGTQVLLQNGLLTYAATQREAAQVAYNTMRTPKGRQFVLQLPDGTRIWLNAESALTYPARFSGAERRVEVSGEAYFEVAQNAKQPFIVTIKDKAEVEVLGTRFNVNAYENEKSINTLLLEGSVKVKVGPNNIAGQQSKQKIEAILKPGQQAQIIPATVTRSADRQPASAIKVITAPNADKVMAWKNGVFNFEGDSLAEVMRQLERWYDIEVVYEKGVPDIRFGGEISRGVSLAGLIAGLQASEVHFRIEEGRRLVVMP